MGEENEVIDEVLDDVIEEELEDEIEEELPEEDETQDEGAEESEADEESEEEDVIVVTIGDEEPEEDNTPAPKWVKDVRKQNRELQKELRELKTQQVKPPEPVGALTKPELADFDYDADAYTEALETHFVEKQKQKKIEQEQHAQQEALNQAWQKKVDGYNKGKASYRDFEDAEEVILESFSDVQQNVVLQYSKDPTLLVYALGKNKKKAQELAQISDPVEFAIKARDIEKSLKVKGKSTKPAPEKTIKGSSRIAGSSDATLERLRTRATKSGDFFSSNCLQT